MKLLCNNIMIASNIKVANTFVSRLIGLLGRKSIDYNEGLLIMRCSSIHCFFMKFTIDAVYLSKDMEVLYKETVKPWEIGEFVKNAYNILELKEFKAKEINVGDILRFVE